MIAILVPVLRRAHQIQPLLDSIAEASSIPYRVVFICSRGDTEARKACQASGSETIVTTWKAGRADFARKMNLAYERTDEPWLFQAATDLVFRKGWDKRAIQMGTMKKVGVIGTNDLGNPYVQRGHHSTHTMFSRDYIEEFGGTFDGSGKVFSEVYDHQFVDTEFIQTALMRRQFIPSKRSIVEHLHPHWGKGEMDETYEKANRDFAGDAEIYRERLAAARLAHGLAPRPGSRQR